MRYSLSVPSRMNLLGNPTDATEGDFATISVAIDIRAGATLEPADGLILESSQRDEAGPSPVVLEFDRDDHPLPYDDRLDLLKAAVNRLHQFSCEFRTKRLKDGVHIAVWTDVPFQSGLGGSSLLALLTLVGLREFYELDRRAHNDYVMAELTQRTESKELGITCGFADRYVPLFGGLAYIDYRGKLQQDEIGQEPYATYERLDQRVTTLPLVLVCPGLSRDSGDVHGRMRPIYLQEHEEWQRRGGAMPPMVRFMSDAWRTAWQGKIALLHGDLPAVGELMNQNHKLVDEMMIYCGFEDGAGSLNNMLIRTALENGAFSAKLTGAGGGGSVFALTPPGGEERVATAWRRAVSAEGLARARVYTPKISSEGLEIRTE